MTVEQIAEICHEAIRKVSPEMDTPWARLPKTQKLANVADVQKALDTENVYPDTDAGVEMKLVCGIVRALAPLVAGYEDFGRATGEPEGESPAAAEGQETLGAYLNNHNPPYLAIKRGDRMVLSARLELGSKLLINGSLFDHRDYPQQDGVPLGVL
jgi:hypothetical protein